MKTIYNKKGKKVNKKLYYIAYSLIITGISFLVFLGIGFILFYLGVLNVAILWLLGTASFVCYAVGIPLHYASGSSNRPIDNMVIDENIKHSIVTNFDEPHYSNLDELPKLKKLLDDGIITQEEFELKKKQLLGL